MGAGCEGRAPAGAGAAGRNAVTESRAGPSEGGSAHMLASQWDTASCSEAARARQLTQQARRGWRLIPAKGRRIGQRAPTADADPAF